MLGRPRYISETRASPSDSLKCLTLGLGRMTGMFAGGGGQRLEKLFPKSRMSPERPYEILGHRSWPKEASRRADANCLRPQAEFSRPSGRGRRPVQNFVVALAALGSDPQGR